MSKPVRLPDYLAEEIERLAQAEKRSLANMVRVLLEQALKLDGSLSERPEAETSPPANPQPAGLQMSAAEKLRKLGAHNPEGINHTDAKGSLLFSALPQIVAVVVAAEEVASVPRTVRGNYTNTLYTNAASRLQDALSALDMALS